jgi:hypothetical protein
MMEYHDGGSPRFQIPAGPLRYRKAGHRNPLNKKLALPRQIPVSNLINPFHRDAEAAVSTVFPRRILKPVQRNPS